MRRTMLLLLVAVALAAVGCAGGETAGRADRQEARSQQNRITEPEADAEDVRLLAAAGRDLSVELYSALRSQDGNLCFSPYSIHRALTMVAGGAEGETKRQMTDALRLALLGDRAHPAYNVLDRALTALAMGSGEFEGAGFSLRRSSALWAQQGRDFQSGYLDLLSTQYNAGILLVDYVGAPAEAADTINDWVLEQSDGRVSELIPDGALGSLTRLVFVDAIDFNASWEVPFSSARTVDALFFPQEGQEKHVQMMRREGRLRYARSAGYRALEIPYVGGRLVLTLILPDPGRFDAFQGNLTVDQMDAIVASLGESTLLDLGLPVFRCESRISLADPLRALGMTDLFQPGAANLFGMDRTRELYLDDVVHHAAMEVSENGTNVSAATVSSLAAGATPVQEMPVTVMVDRPFIFLVRDTDTGTILLMGRVLDPSAQ